ncbi:MAG: DUF423 domain-containing protein [Chitinophagaceae bacterium]|nr:DUF423 domain-containing protein [Chitinophagaceae bacterium]
MPKTFLMLASLFSALAVILGAFGAHGLKKILPAESLTAFETGVRYQFYHCFALFVVALAFEKGNKKWMKYAGYFFVTGILLFSGSLYLLTFLKAADTVGLNGIGVITPVGGLFFVAGWIALLIGFGYKGTIK